MSSDIVSVLKSLVVMEQKTRCEAAWKAALIGLATANGGRSEREMRRETEEWWDGGTVGACVDRGAYLSVAIPRGTS